MAPPHLRRWSRLHDMVTEALSPRTNELNDLLGQLCQIYPNRSVARCRDVIALISSEYAFKSAKDKLELSAAILADEAGNEAAGEEPVAYRAAGIEPSERFRSVQYVEAVSKVLKIEFKKLSSSTIKTVLLENNHDYARTKAQLATIANRSWLYTFKSLFSRQPKSVYPTGCEELDDEIDAMQNAGARQQQLEADEAFARTLNEAQAQDTNALFECECCFSDVAWEDVCFCTEMHCFCRRCLRTSVEASLYGQGAGIDYAHASARCISSAANPACTAHVAPALLPHFLPPEVAALLDAHLAKRAVDHCAGPLLRCPFCFYAVVDDHRTEEHTLQWARSLFSAAPGANIGVAIIAYVLPSAALFWSLFLEPLWIVIGCATLFLLNVFGIIGGDSSERPRWASILRCENPHCGRSSCLRCGREWLGIHDCARDNAQSKRQYVARRMDEALKRTCPECRTSFVKDGGCNRMTCTCGYRMCYLCRADVRSEGYAHFCRHFRSDPGTACKQCTKCLLFADEEEAVVLRAAKAEAEREWEARRHRV